MFIHTYTQKNNMRGFHENWHVAAFTLQKDMLGPMTKWCYETFGNSGYHPLTDEYRWSDDIRYGEVQFSRKEDLEWFVLRWS